MIYKIYNNKSVFWTVSSVIKYDRCGQVPARVAVVGGKNVTNIQNHQKYQTNNPYEHMRSFHFCVFTVSAVVSVTSRV